MNYAPTLGMLRELARVRLGDASAEPMERQRCERRGLIDWRGRLTVPGLQLLRTYSRRAQRHG